jgi:hypothetical protein
MADRTPGDTSGDGETSGDTAGSTTGITSGEQEHRPPGASSSGNQPHRRRRTTVLLIAGGVLLVAAVVVGVLVLGNRPAPELAVPEPEIVTLPVPSPTVQPVAREDGTAFFDSLPSTILSYALIETGEAPDLLASGALEGYRMVYTDGGAVDLTVRAAQWPTPEGAVRALERITATHADALSGPGVERAAVEVDGTEVGQYVFLPHGDTTATAWWTNGTVLIEVVGPEETVADVYLAFPL